MAERRTGYDWNKLTHSGITDPDGWDRTGDGDRVFFHGTPITMDDFMSRKMRSSIMMKMHGATLWDKNDASAFYERLEKYMKDIHRIANFMD